METTHYRLMKQQTYATRVLTMALFFTLVLWIVMLRPATFGQLESIAVVAALMVFGGYGLTFNRRLLTRGASAALLVLFIAQIITAQTTQSLRTFIPIFLLQFVAFLALLRLVELTARQSVAVSAIRGGGVVETLRQPSYAHGTRYLKFNLASLLLASGSAYFLSLLVLGASFVVGGSLFAPFDVGIYIIALVVALLAILTHAPHK